MVEGNREVKGVYLQNGRWQVRVWIDGKIHFVGHASSQAEGILMQEEYRRKYERPLAPGHKRCPKCSRGFLPHTKGTTSWEKRLCLTCLASYRVGVKLQEQASTDRITERVREGPLHILANPAGIVIVLDKEDYVEYKRTGKLPLAVTHYLEEPHEEPSTSEEEEEEDW